jgi:hypothetical protein
MQMPGLIPFAAKPTDFDSGRRAFFQKNGRLYDYVSFRQFCRNPSVPGERHLARHFGYHFQKTTAGFTFFLRVSVPLFRKGKCLI